jgi:hypothetical protein
MAGRAVTGMVVGVSRKSIGHSRMREVGIDPSPARGAHYFEMAGKTAAFPPNVFRCSQNNQATLVVHDCPMTYRKLNNG